MKRQKKKTDDRGVAMIVAIVVGVVIMAFCLSMLLVTYTLFAQTNRQTTQMQCKLMAQSFSEMLREDLKPKKNEPDSDLTKYLGDKIKDGSFAPLDTEDGDLPIGAEKEILLVFDENSTTKDTGYTIYATFTYETNSAEDDEDGQEEKDDQDVSANGISGGGGTGGGSADPSAEKSGGTYILYVNILCVRGDKDDRDAQSYTQESIYSLTVKN